MRWHVCKTRRQEGRPIATVRRLNDAVETQELREKICLPARHGVEVYEVLAAGKALAEVRPWGASVVVIPENIRLAEANLGGRVMAECDILVVPSRCNQARGRRDRLAQPLHASIPPSRHQPGRCVVIEPDAVGYPKRFLKRRSRPTACRKDRQTSPRRALIPESPSAVDVKTP
jgi:hypothetical protein